MLFAVVSILLFITATIRRSKIICGLSIAFLFIDIVLVKALTRRKEEREAKTDTSQKGG